MFGIRFIKTQPTDYIIQFKKGAIKREGLGLSFFYFAPTTSLVRISQASVDVPFMFSEVTKDFQEITIQGQIAYKVEDPKKLSSMLNFTVRADGDSYASDDPEKLPHRLVNHVQVLTRSQLKSLDLKEAMGASDGLVKQLIDGFNESKAIDALGIEILDISIIAIKPTPETARALEAEIREHMLKEADDAIYTRRNAAVEQERLIKENELNTDIAVEKKKQQIRETKMDAEMSVQKKDSELKESRLAAEVELEEKRKELVETKAQNTQCEADAQAYSLSAIMKALSDTDPKVLQVLSSMDMDPGRLVALAFKDLADGAEKIGQLNVSPDLLRELMAK